MADKTLVKLGPFEGVELKADQYYLEPTQGVTATNVDTSYRGGSFSSAMGRNILANITLPAGYTIQCVAPIVSFSGEGSLIGSIRRYVFSSTNGTQSYQGWYDPNSFGTYQLKYASPFTQAIQFGSSLWTNGGDKIYYLSNGTLDSDIWQISVPYGYSYNVTGTYAATTGGAPYDTYTYAITIRKAEFWSVSGVSPNIVLQPDIDSLQESSPVFSTGVQISSGQPGFTVPTAQGLGTLLSGQTPGNDTYYGALYRSRIGAPGYVFVDYLVNLTQMNDHNGNPSIIDTYSEAAIQNNAYLITAHDPPPLIGQTYAGAIANNSSSKSLLQQQQQVAFTYKNPGFITKHKGRMFCFTMYPTEAIGSYPPLSPTTISLQPQLWYSDAGLPWSFDSVNGVLLVGPEDAPGNYAIDAGIITNPPWQPGMLEDSPMGLASAGTLLVMFKSQTTWMLNGDSPSEFVLGVRRVCDIGCVASNSITAAEGGVFWLASQGVYFFSGGKPEYISEDVSGLLDGLTQAQLSVAVGSYQNRTFLLSVAGQTLCYYLPTKKWYTRSYSTNFALFNAYNSDQLIFVNGSSLNSVGVNASTDLGQPIVSTWTSGVTDSGAPNRLKKYQRIHFVAPIQPGTCSITLTLDANAGITNTYVATWDLSLGNGAHVISLPDKMQGYEAQVTVTTTTSAKATLPISIRAVEISGDITHALMPIAHDPALTSQFLNGAQVTNG